MKNIKDEVLFDIWRVQKKFQTAKGRVAAKAQEYLIEVYVSIKDKIEEILAETEKPQQLALL